MSKSEQDHERAAVETVRVEEILKAANVGVESVTPVYQVNLNAHVTEFHLTEGLVLWLMHGRKPTKPVPPGLRFGGH